LARSRPGVRERLVIISKGAHPNEHRARLTPEDITCDLRDTLARLDGPVDLYLLHRDDPQVPVGPIVEILDQHRRTGHIRAYGASNWTPRRIDEANAYAATHALDPFRVSSTHLSLAVQNEEHWPGALSATDPTMRAWHERTQMPLFAWSALALGFFTGRYARGDDSHATIRRVYFSEENWERLRRAQIIARERGCTANQVALAWVLHQPFPVYGVIGPQTVSELRAAVTAVDVELDDAEAAWLNLESDARTRPGLPHSGSSPSLAGRSPDSSEG
jgi:aryl-alcohol dehydrogenase-like predicted oxidoreductase